MVLIVFWFPDIHVTSPQNLSQFSPRELKSIELAPEEFTSISSLRSAPPGVANFASTNGVRTSPKAERMRHAQEMVREAPPSYEDETGVAI